MIITYDPHWGDTKASWWVKANRAKEHINTLRRLVEEFRQSEPYSLTPEPTSNPDILAYRLTYLKAIPADISATIGDALHNLRSALESLAYAVAAQGQGGTLTADQERVPAFPICNTPTVFQDFFKGKKGKLYNSQARSAFRSVQDFANLEEAHRLGVALDRKFEDAAHWGILHRLDTLWNVDKHRRLALLTWWPDLIYWTSDGPSNRRLLPGDDTFADGSILFHIQGSDEGQGTSLSHTFNLTLKDDPAFSSDGNGATEDVVDLLEACHQHIVDLVVFPRVFTLMSQTSMPR